MPTCTPNYPTDLPKACAATLFTALTTGNFGGELIDATYAVGGYLIGLVRSRPAATDGTLASTAPGPTLTDATASALFQQMSRDDVESQLDPATINALLSFLISQLLPRILPKLIGSN